MMRQIKRTIIFKKEDIRQALISWLIQDRQQTPGNDALGQQFSLNENEAVLVWTTEHIQEIK